MPAPVTGSPLVDVVAALWAIVVWCAHGAYEGESARAVPHGSPRVEAAVAVTHSPLAHETVVYDRGFATVRNACCVAAFPARENAEVDVRRTERTIGVAAIADGRVKRGRWAGLEQKVHHVIARQRRVVGSRICVAFVAEREGAFRRGQQ